MSAIQRCLFTFCITAGWLGCCIAKERFHAEVNSSPPSAVSQTPSTSPPPRVSASPSPTITPSLPPRNEPSATPTPEIKICSPLSSTQLEELPSIVSNGFHPPPPGQDGRHQGVDFAYYRRFGRDSIAGESVQSILPGKVAGLVYNRFPYGNALIVETSYLLLPTWIKETLTLDEDESLYVLYAHLAEFYPKEIGETITSCQLLGLVGKSGNANVPHLHLEVRVGKQAQVLPSMASYVTDASPEERQAYYRWRTSGEFRAVDPMLILTKPAD